MPLEDTGCTDQPSGQRRTKEETTLSAGPVCAMCLNWWFLYWNYTSSCTFCLSTECKYFYQLCFWETIILKTNEVNGSPFDLSSSSFWNAFAFVFPLRASWWSQCSLLVVPLMLTLWYLVVPVMWFWLHSSASFCSKPSSCCAVATTAAPEEWLRMIEDWFSGLILPSPLSLFVIY